MGNFLMKIHDFLLRTHDSLTCYRRRAPKRCLGSIGGELELRYCWRKVEREKSEERM